MGDVRLLSRPNEYVDGFEVLAGRRRNEPHPEGLEPVLVNCEDSSSTKGKKGEPSRISQSPRSLNSRKSHSVKNADLRRSSVSRTRPAFTLFSKALGDFRGGLRKADRVNACRSEL